jgi:transposase
MARSLKVRRLRASERRKLEKMLTGDLHPQQRRRAQVLLLYSEGLTGVEIAAGLQFHPQTVYQDLRAFAQEGLAALQPPARGGAAKQLTIEQEAEIGRLAELSPIEVGQPYGRWSLANLRAYLLKARIVKQISREHLRRVLKKGGCASAECNANLSAPIPSDWRS